MYIYTVNTIEKAMMNALSIYHTNDKEQVLKIYNDIKRDTLRMSYKEAKQRSSQGATRLYECIWLLNKYQMRSSRPNYHTKITLSKRIDTFYTIDRSLQSMPEILEEALIQQARNNPKQRERFSCQETLREKYSLALKQKNAHDKNITYLKKRPPSAPLKRRPKL